jgi:hypothetical protein
MSQIAHSADQNLRAGIKGGLVLGDTVDILNDADLASTAAAAKTAVNTANNLLHISQRQFGPRVNASLDAIGDYDSTYLGGSDVDKTTMLAISNSPGGRSAAF